MASGVTEFGLYMLLKRQSIEAGWSSHASGGSIGMLSSLSALGITCPPSFSGVAKS